MLTIRHMRLNRTITETSDKWEEHAERISGQLDRTAQLLCLALLGIALLAGTALIISVTSNTEEG